MKISIKVEDKTVTATLIDSKTTQDFISLLPLTLTMNDLFRREKFAHLPRAISDEGQRTQNYEVGEIPKPGIIVIGKIDSDLEAFNVPGSLKATVELDKTSIAPKYGTFHCRKRSQIHGLLQQPTRRLT